MSVATLMVMPIREIKQNGKWLGNDCPYEQSLIALVNSHWLPLWTVTDWQMREEQRSMWQLFQQSENRNIKRKVT